MITFIEAFKKELENEAVQTKRMLAIVPADKLDWRPHPKSMDIRTLATHLAEIPQMISMGLTKDKWDFAEPTEPAAVINTTEELLTRFEESLAEARIALDESNDDILQQPWVMCSGDQVWLTLEKWETFRHAMGQNAHHRAQLQVNLRLLDIPVPGPYGPSADEMG
jgi:uncharacterized damage-inducible protein DinB